MARAKTNSVALPTTVAEAIAYYSNSKERGADFIPDMKDGYLTIGQSVILGGLKNPVVEHLMSSKTVLISHDETDRYTKVTTRAFMTTTWCNIYPINDNASHLTKEPVISHYSANDVDGLIHKAINFGIDFEPEVQRDYEWTDLDKERLLNSVMNGIDIGKFVFVRRPFPALTLIIDGKQRLSTLIDFFLGKISYKGIYFHELSIRDRQNFLMLQTSYCELPENTSRLKILRVFLEVNTGGVPVAPEHLTKVEAMYQEELLKVGSTKD